MHLTVIAYDADNGKAAEVEVMTVMAMVMAVMHQSIVVLHLPRGSLSPASPLFLSLTFALSHSECLSSLTAIAGDAFSLTHTSLSSSYNFFSCCLPADLNRKGGVVWCVCVYVCVCLS